MARQGFVAPLVLASKTDLGVLGGALDFLAGGFTTFLRSLSSSFSIYSISLLATDCCEVKDLARLWLARQGSVHAPVNKNTV